MIEVRISLGISLALKFVCVLFGSLGCLVLLESSVAFSRDVLTFARLTCLKSVPDNNLSLARTVRKFSRTLKQLFLGFWGIFV